MNLKGIANGEIKHRSKPNHINNPEADCVKIINAYNRTTFMSGMFNILEAPYAKMTKFLLGHLTTVRFTLSQSRPSSGTVFHVV